MKQLNSQHIKTVMQLINQSPYFQLISMQVCELDLGYARMEAQQQNKHLNPYGGVHGGVYASLMDAAAYWSIYSELDEEADYTTLDLQIDYLGISNAQKLIAEGRRIKTGRSIHLAQVSLHDETGKQLAYGTSKMAVINGTPTILKAMAASGLGVLPAKFL